MSWVWREEEWKNPPEKKLIPGVWNVELVGRRYIVTSPGGIEYTVSRELARERMSVVDCSREVEAAGALEIAAKALGFNYHSPNRVRGYLK